VKSSKSLLEVGSKTLPASYWLALKPVFSSLQSRVSACRRAVSLSLLKKKAGALFHSSLGFPFPFSFLVCRCGGRGSRVCVWSEEQKEAEAEGKAKAYHTSAGEPGEDCDWGQVSPAPVSQLDRSRYVSYLPWIGAESWIQGQGSAWPVGKAATLGSSL
jgi:hypothetical protein